MKSGGGCGGFKNFSEKPIKRDKLDEIFQAQKLRDPGNATGPVNYYGPENALPVTG